MLDAAEPHRGTYAGGQQLGPALPEQVSGDAKRFGLQPGFCWTRAPTLDVAIISSESSHPAPMPAAARSPPRSTSPTSQPAPSSVTIT